jgi:hypothetical protein
MKYSRVLLGIIGSLCFIALALAATNLLLNPGFESGLTNWTDLYGAPTGISNTVFRSGTKSAYKYVNSVSSEYWTQIYQEVNYVAGEPLYASVYAKSNFSPLATTRAGLKAEFMNNSGTVLATANSREIGGTVTNWRLLELNNQSAPTGTTKVRLSGYLWAAKDDTISLIGEVYLDDANLIKQYQALQPQTKLLNTGFENGVIDWSIGGVPVKATNSIVYDGNYAIYANVDSVVSRDFWSQGYQEIAWAGGKKTFASVFIKTTFSNASAQGKGGLMIEFINSSGNILRQIIQTVSGQTDWKRVYIYYLAPTGTVKVRFSVFCHAPQGNTPSVGGKAYFDKATLLGYLPVQ